MVVLVLAGCVQQNGGSSSPSPPGYSLRRCTGQAVPTTTAAPPVARPSVYVGSVGRIGTTFQYGAFLYAFSSQKGSEHWCDSFFSAVTYNCPHSCPAPPPIIVGQPLLAASVLYVCVWAGQGVTYAINAGDGDVRWQRETGCLSGSVAFTGVPRPFLANGLLYTGNCALDPADGFIRLTLPVHAWTAAVVGDTIYAYSGGTISALAAGSDKLRWQYQLSARSGTEPVVTGGRVYAGDINGIYGVVSGLPDALALDAESGKILWRYPTDIVSSISANDSIGLAFFGAQYGLYALDTGSGKLRWRFPTKLGTITTPIAAGNMLYFTEDGAYAVNALNGKLQWHNPLGASQSTYSTGATLLGNTLYLGQSDGEGNTTLYALSASNGSVLWHVGGINQMSPTVAG